MTSVEVGGMFIGEAKQIRFCRMGEGPQCQACGAAGSEDHHWRERKCLDCISCIAASHFQNIE